MLLNFAKKRAFPASSAKPSPVFVPLGYLPKRTVQRAFSGAETALPGPRQAPKKTGRKALPVKYCYEELFKRTKKAIVKYNMLADEQGVMVGLSGGKDSATLLYVLKKFQPLSRFKYKLAAGHIGLGFPGEDVSPLEEYCRQLDVPFFHEKTKIGPLVFEVRRESNPCSLCAKLRRGALNNLALANGYTKVALGHHQDDVLETLLLKTFFEGNIASFNPVTWLDRKGVTVIRPFVYAPEDLVAHVAKECGLPVVASLCPAGGLTRRQDMKEFLRELDALSPEAKDRATSALERLFEDKWDGRK